jgi:hypothetical protein
VHNLESQRRQYGLADRARQLGWTTVEIIDDDPGRDGSTDPATRTQDAAIQIAWIGPAIPVRSRGRAGDRDENDVGCVPRARTGEAAIG